MLVSQLCPTLCDPMDCSPPGFSVPESLQARILEWVAISFSICWVYVNTISCHRYLSTRVYSQEMDKVICWNPLLLFAKNSSHVCTHSMHHTFHPFTHTFSPPKCCLFLPQPLSLQNSTHGFTFQSACCMLFLLAFNLSCTSLRAGWIKYSKIKASNLTFQFHISFWQSQKKTGESG